MTIEITAVFGRFTRN